MSRDDLVTLLAIPVHQVGMGLSTIPQFLKVIRGSFLGTRPYSAAQAALELVILLLQPPEFWDYRLVSSHAVVLITITLVHPFSKVTSLY